MAPWRLESRRRSADQTARCCERRAQMCLCLFSLVLLSLDRLRLVLIVHVPRHTAEHHVVRGARVLGDLTAGGAMSACLLFRVVERAAQDRPPRDLLSPKAALSALLGSKSSGYEADGPCSVLIPLN